MQREEKGDPGVSEAGEQRAPPHATAAAEARQGVELAPPLPYEALEGEGFLLLPQNLV